MKLTKCSNGHFYDADAFATCPHCSPKAAAKETMPYEDSGALNVTTPFTNSINVPAGTDGATIGMWDDPDVSTPPVVGWVVCIKGKHSGKSFNLKAGRNFVGRNAQYDVALEGEETVSRDIHVEIVYDPMSNSFMVAPGTSRSLCYVNKQLVMTPTVLKKNDVMIVGAVELMFVPFCDDVFKW